MPDHKVLYYCVLQVLLLRTSKIFKVLQGTTQYYSVLYSTTMYYTVLQCTTKYCSVLQSTTLYYTVLQSTTQYYNVLQSIALYYSILQSITRYYTVLQCATKYCRAFWNCFPGSLPFRNGSKRDCYGDRKSPHWCLIHRDSYTLCRPVRHQEPGLHVEEYGPSSSEAHLGF